MTKPCADCHEEEGTEKAYRFDDEHEGDECLLCKACYEKHEELGDWVS